MRHVSLLIERTPLLVGHVPPVAARERQFVAARGLLAAAAGLVVGGAILSAPCGPLVIAGVFLVVPKLVPEAGPREWSLIRRLPVP